MGGVADRGYALLLLPTAALFDGPGRTVIDGPFAETQELIAGLSICLQIQPLSETADLAESLTPETRAKLGVAWYLERQRQSSRVNVRHRPQAALGYVLTAE